MASYSAKFENVIMNHNRKNEVNKEEYDIVLTKRLAPLPYGLLSAKMILDSNAIRDVC